MVMTNNKPNAYIELGWAMGLWRNPIILHRSGLDVPSDISDLVNVPYDPKALSSDDPQPALETGALLAKAVLNRLANAPRQKPFDDHLKRSQLAYGKVDILGRAQDVSFAEWSQQFHDAKKFITVASSNTLKLFDNDFLDTDGSDIDLEELLLKRALDGVQVTILMRHPENYSEDHLRRQGMKKGTGSAIKDLETAYHIWNTQRQTYDSIRNRDRPDLPKDGFRVVRMRKRYLPFRASLTEDSLFYTFRFYTQKVNSGLCMLASADPHDMDEYNLPVFEQVRRELDYLIAQNADASEQEYQSWLVSQAPLPDLDADILERDA
eukprot:TRINITY_DN30100_c0_g1_i1.p1 TRINITY_DN30100_c0_g1~~TRINITY_DN30100_c0_g1_i1.p1  ORF type:complete len:322 (-),score=18.34 TRINITY_DN30100_c0_g1_i1:12-977(-)